MKITASTYPESVARALAASVAYEQTDELLLSDTEFDELLADIKDYEADNGITVEHDLYAIGHGGAVAGKVAHTSLMPSLSKVGREALEAFVAKGFDAVLEPKIDGLAMALTYENGRFVRAVRRGDGLSGDDMTSRLVRVEGMPTVAASPETMEVRGEVYLSDAGLVVANEMRDRLGKAPFANARNGASGMVNKADGSYDGMLSFAAYGVVFEGGRQLNFSHTDAMEYLSVLGFTTALSLLPAEVTDAGDVLAQVDALGKVRPTLPLLTDGAVVKANDPAVRLSMGEGTRAPKWAVAYKYAPLEAPTTVTYIERTIGKTGRLGLRGWLQPVRLDGSIIDRVSLHNQDWLTKADIRVGDTVMMSKRGDVIPYSERVLLELRPADSVPYVVPPECPSCDQPLDKTTELWRCLNPECSVTGRLEYAASVSCFDIQGLGNSVAEALAEFELAKDVADLFHLTEEQYADLITGYTKDGNPRRLGAKNAAKIMSELELAKSKSWARVINSLSMRMTGRTVSGWLAAAFPTKELLLSATLEQLQNVDGIGTGKAAAILAGLAANADVLERLEAAGVTMSSVVDESAANGLLAGMSVCVTGKVADLGRTQVQELIESQGGKASSGVSATTSLLVAAEAGSSKYVKAEKMGVTITDPSTFLESIEKGIKLWEK